MIKYPNSVTEHEAIELNKFCNRLTNFFGIKIDSMSIIEVKSRADFDKFFREKTENWLVGETRGKTVYILKKNKFESDSIHKEEEYLQILKHEICHIFISKINNDCPSFLAEGLCENFAGQTKRIKIKEENLKNFFGKDIFYVNYNYNEFANKEGYSISFWVVKELLENFSNSVIIDLIKISKKSSDWKKQIENITGISYEQYLKIAKSKL